MRTTIDKAGRLVIPKELRERVGLGPGEVDVRVEGATLRVEPLASDRLTERNGRLTVPPSGDALDDDRVQSLRDVDQR
ncbi:AbrB/MazE/SpoVT family DNA-binding domain-containing protein [Blastococcus sp. BMG 814]|jgi:AbrB family looped-hinge helix DNA binding protein|uniref:AbrB/MazE/SpoVT family DNA-binding domain-containing protein n=1 Tax=Blastococcus carthaginiensis TaxID=3050034 RepID=A0ABT9ICH2_9ACTN|nr:AbrB/MazE/SpoVT family DNA-binding domain-containing protein [Blastococcus carthaginiensis]MDP5183268.1 AbrB/MazE/SpoVT family DNA-binding domain-containing protein [Blastococcus carthaginiensis]